MAYCFAHHVLLVVDACLVLLLISPTDCQLIRDLWAGLKSCYTLLVLDGLPLPVFSQGHKWIWGNQEICGHKVSVLVPASLTVHKNLFSFSKETVWSTMSNAWIHLKYFPIIPSCHLPGYQKASEPGAIGHGWDLRGSGRRDPAEVVLALQEAALGCGCQVHHAGPFLLSCTHGVAGGHVAFEAEVCHLSTGTSETSNGVRYTRLWGAPLAFRDIATKISKDLEL